MFSQVIVWPEHKEAQRSVGGGDGGKAGVVLLTNETAAAAAREDARLAAARDASQAKETDEQQAETEVTQAPVTTTDRAELPRVKLQEIVDDISEAEREERRKAELLEESVQLRELIKEKLQKLVAKTQKEKSEAKQVASEACHHLLDIVEDATDRNRALAEQSKAYAVELLKVIELRAAQDSEADAVKESSLRHQEVVTALSKKVADCSQAIQEATDALDRALSHSAGLGEVDHATGTSQKASSAIQELHRVAEEAAEAQADVNVVEHYFRQVEKRHQQRQEELKRLSQKQAQLEEKVEG